MAEKRPLWAKCGACGHCWPVAYLPLVIELLAKLLDAGFICPMCGDTKPMLAKQNNGVLQEEPSQAVLP